MPQAPRMRAIFKLLRPHQWSKNMLVVLPVVFAHQLGMSSAMVREALAFLAFNITASAAYVFNDLLDRDRDREHPTKRRRPIASGAVSPMMAYWIIFLLLLLNSYPAMMLGWPTALALLGYLMLTTLYSKWLKSRVLVDVFVLAGLYTTRIIVGSIAVRVVPSIWLLSLSMFIFFSLALVKRFTELELVESKQPDARLLGRDYRASDIDTLRAMGVSSGTTAVLILALYIDSTQAARQYANPLWLWPTCPILWYWLSRMWIKTTRGQMHDDPIVYSLRDRGSWVSFGAIVLCWTCASLGLPPNLD